MATNPQDPPPSARPQEGSRIDLTTTLYGELHRLARARMAGQPGPQTLQATALLHEAWLRLGGEDQPHWNDRRHYFAAVAEAMRHILVDRARRRKRLRHGGGLQRVELDAWNWEAIDPTRAATHDDSLLVVQESLEHLSRIDPESAEIVKLRFFAGLTLAEIAETLNRSLRTTERRFAFARAWLARQIRRAFAA